MIKMMIAAVKVQSSAEYNSPASPFDRRTSLIFRLSSEALGKKSQLYMPRERDREREKRREEELILSDRQPPGIKSLDIFLLAKSKVYI